MGKLNTHWTSASTNDFLYRVGSDFVQQLEDVMKEPETSQAALAEALGVSEGRVSQVLNNPGNLTLRKVIEYARALNRKVAIVVYNDHDPKNRNGPINSRIFTSCWEMQGRPSDFFELNERWVSTSHSVERSPSSLSFWPADLSFAEPIGPSFYFNAPPQQTAISGQAVVASSLRSWLHGSIIRPFAANNTLSFRGWPRKSLTWTVSIDTSGQASTETLTTISGDVTWQSQPK